MITRVRLAVRLLLSVATLAASILRPHPAAAKDVSLFLPPNNISIIESTPPRPGAAAKSYTATAPDAEWNVVAWNIPGGDLPPFKKSVRGPIVIYTSKAAEASITVKQAPSGTSYDLLQDGAFLPCNTEDGKPRESDLFLHPNNSLGPTGGLEGNAYILKRNTISIGELSHLISEATVGFSYKPSAGSPPTCPVSQGAPMMAVILINRVAKQTLFYQLDLAVACGPQPEERQARCERNAADPQAGFFSKKQPYGVDDRIPLMGVPFLKNGEKRAFRLDLLPRLKSFIQSGPEDMDHDPSHWVVNSYYNGQNVFGRLVLRSSWSDVKLVAGMDH